MTLPPKDSAGSPGAERVLAEALQVMAGGDRAPALAQSGPRESAAANRTPLQLVHIVLLAAIVGLLVGVIAGLILA